MPHDRLLVHIVRIQFANIDKSEDNAKGKRNFS